MNWDRIDWAALERLRAGFLAGSAGQRDYWETESDLASYDATFAQRIGWKWSHVLRELEAAGWKPAPGALWDWGCGTGIAGRVFLDHFGTAEVSHLILTDRSSLAVEFARRRAHQRFPQLRVDSGRKGAPATLLLSHILTELSDQQLQDLISIVRRATALVWVEPGTYETSRRLGRLRDQLREEFRVIAPCTHQRSCPIFQPQNGQHWCHHFAEVPPEVFTDSNWARFGHIAGVDLRSLPLSFLVLDKRPQSSAPASRVCLIGNPRVYKAHALLLGCDECGLHDARLSKRRSPETFRLAKKGQLKPVQFWRLEGQEIVEMKPITGVDTRDVC
jgi:hypothetical protein